MWPDDEPFDDNAFLPNFVVTPDALPSSAPHRVYYYPGASTHGGRDRLILSVVSVGTSRGRASLPAAILAGCRTMFRAESSRFLAEGASSPRATAPACRFVQVGVSRDNN